MKKVTFIGDIVCDKEMLKNSKNSANEYDFSKMFEPLNNYFNDSDYIITNLETVIDDINFTNSVFSFSNPKSLLLALKNIGVNVVSLANNHILDRGEEGITKTINYLEEMDIAYFGIDDKDYFNINIGKENIAILGYTDSTNYHINKVNVNNLNKHKINMLKDETKRKKIKRNLLSRFYHKLSPDIRINIKNFLHEKLEPIIDEGSIDLNYLNDIKDKVNELKQNHKYIIMYAHMGGQFNENLGSYSKKMIDEFNDIGINYNIITHPHIIQTKYKDNTFSLGDLIISPKSKFVVWDSLPKYSMAVNYYYSLEKLKKITISFFICMEEKNCYLKVYPFYEYYFSVNKLKQKKLLKDFINIYKRVLNQKIKIEKEYVIWEE